jgi:CheY-like chemotaxis protein
MKKKVLYVEDDAINALVMKKLLGTHYDVSHTPDGETCLALLATEPFDMILMDINLGHGQMNGVEILHAIKSNPSTAGMTVIAVTSYALPEDEQRFLQEGFSDYLAKPVDRKLLLDTLHQYLG